MAVRLLGICGSLRKGSVNRMLLNESARLFGESDYAQADLRVPLYDGDLEDAGMPAEVETLIEQVGSADAVIIACPEYNQAMTGVLKNALDWISRGKSKPWLGKPVALVSAAAGRAGGARAQYSLRLAMAPFRPNLVPGPEVLVAGADKEFDGEGRLTNTRYLAVLEELMGDLRKAAGAG